MSSWQQSGLALVSGAPHGGLRPSSSSRLETCPSTAQQTLLWTASLSGLLALVPASVSICVLGHGTGSTVVCWQMSW